MDYINLGKTGLKVSRICLGCMTYGVPDRGAHPWTLTEEESRPFIKRALELGILLRYRQLVLGWNKRGDCRTRLERFRTS